MTSRRWVACALVLLTLARSARAQTLALEFKVLTNGPSAAASTLQGVTYGNASNFVVVGTGNTILNVNMGANGLGWSNRVSVPVAGQDLNAVAFGNGLYITGGQNPASPNTENYDLFSSPDGTTWTSLAHAYADSVVVKGLAFNPLGGSNIFVAVASFPEIGYASAPYTNWNNATIQNLDLEFFRAVTAVGSNGFAACGTGYDIRTSANGSSWSGYQPFFNLSSNTNLLGIASDGNSNVVCVGSVGTILYSGNAGASWAGENSGAGSDLNAVTFTGNGLVVVQGTNAVTMSGFLTVGNGGTILVSTNGTGWTTNGISWQGRANVNDLYAACFATNGPLLGVALLVGANGTIVVAGPVPPAPTNSTPATNAVNYAGYPNRPLEVTVTNTATVDWYDSDGVTLLLSGNTNFIPPTNNYIGADSVSNHTYYAQSRDLRTGFVNTNQVPIVFMVRPRPAATVASTNFTECNYGLPLTNVANVTGLAPLTVWWNDGTTQTVATAGSLSRVVYPTNAFAANAASNNVYFITNVVDTYSNGIGSMYFGNLSGDLTGNVTITVNPRPTATVASTNFTECDYGNPYTSSVTLTGIGTWTVWWNDGSTQTVGTAGSPGPFTLQRTVVPTNIFQANTPFTNVYFVTNVLNADTCLGNQSSDIAGVATVIVNPRPTASLATNTITECDYGQPFTNVVTLTGIGPWTVSWNDGSTNSIGATNSGSNGSFIRVVTPAYAGTNAQFTNLYYITNVITTTNGCQTTGSGDITGTNAIFVYAPPVATVASVSLTNCAGVTNPAFVATVPAGVSVNWYGATTNLITNGVTIFTPTNATPGAITYYAQATNTVTGCGSTNFTALTLLLQSCTNGLTAAPLGSNQIVLGWFGNLELLSSTNLELPLAQWDPVVTNAAPGVPHTWTNSTVSPPPDTFFRLYAPTNSP